MIAMYITMAMMKMSHANLLFDSCIFATSASFSESPSSSMEHEVPDLASLVHCRSLLMWKSSASCITGCFADIPSVM